MQDNSCHDGLHNLFQVVRVQVHLSATPNSIVVQVLLHHVPPAYSRHSLIFFIGNSPQIGKASSPKVKECRYKIWRVVDCLATSRFLPLRFVRPKHHLRLFMLAYIDKQWSEYELTTRGIE
jgi:hypothetical protein